LGNQVTQRTIEGVCIAHDVSHNLSIEVRERVFALSFSTLLLPFSIPRIALRLLGARSVLLAPRLAIFDQHTGPRALAVMRPPWVTVGDLRRTSASRLYFRRFHLQPFQKSHVALRFHGFDWSAPLAPNRFA
jgi:hypothetical protein